ncbi:MAG TPA: substrate-binding domain-containing protein [Gemmataceae bacterium]|nr:substrate-binding domain-containing protein [Gemmataceae bacterium]
MSPPAASRFGQPAALVGLLALEVAVFGLFGQNFLTGRNMAEIARMSVEVGLLAIALTPVIVTGGIDLSVGSLIGLAAVLLGMMWRDAGLPLGLAIVGTLGVGAIGGALNGVLITQLRIPPLIVTLGTFSLFRGLAEGLTRGSDTFTGFPSWFLTLGQGYVGGVPVQLPVLAAVAIGFWLYLHRTTHGRALIAIGFSPEGARHAGLPVGRRVFVVYLLCGLVTSLAAIVYVAHVGQARADAGTGYELAAITAVVLGGTSIFGGRGSIAGTVLGLFVIVVLQNGLRLADLPAELAGILTGTLLLLTIGLDWLRSRPAASTPTDPDAFTMRNSQLAVLCVVILAAAGLIAGSNWYLVKSLPQVGGPANSTPTRTGKKITIAMMPKSKGNAYFIACRKGAEEAAKELGIELIWDGPTDTDAVKQAEVIETWITRGVDVIAVAVENQDGLSPVLEKARANGIKVVTWDADARPEARDFFVNQATPEGIAKALVDNAARVMDQKGEFAVIMATLTAANQVEWRKQIEKYVASAYPQMKIAVVRPCDDQQKKANEETTTILNAYPNVKLVMPICSPAVPGAAEAIKAAGRQDVKVVGLSLPNQNKTFVHDGITDSVILWNTMDLGYLAVYAAVQLMDGKLKPGDTSIEAGKLGKKEIRGTDILLGVPFRFHKGNIDQFDF